MAMSTRDRAYYAHTATNDYFGFVPRARSSRSSHSDYPPTLPPPYDEISRRRTSARTSSNYSTARLETSFSRLRGPLPSTERRSTRTFSLSGTSTSHSEPSGRLSSAARNFNTPSDRYWLREPQLYAAHDPHIEYAAHAAEVSLRNGETIAMREVAPTGRQLQFDSDQNQRLAHGSFASTVPYLLPARDRSRKMETHGRYRIVYP
ncbi:hypothetical protein B0A48_08969 [Cryoendolithus antarcticus]|uniref:Uncharacterized protein n=1 Tax=Cryoendolithus antarcticus TaxID=1507870 RepID=A0A1V8T4Z0_9PEZI|nr:hypothetical protein B0A48_08969 [Cryoendolithus antarcticus]